MTDFDDETLSAINERQRVLIDTLRERIETQRRALHATQLRAERAEAETAAIRTAVEVTLDGCSFCRAGICTAPAHTDLRAALQGGAGAALLSELAAGRAVVEELQKRRRQSGRCVVCGFGRKLDGEEFHGEGCAVAAYEQATGQTRRL
jgi:hypothetical protein